MMENLSKKEQELYNNYLDEKLKNLQKYRDLANAMILLYSKINLKLNKEYKCYLGSQGLKNNNGDHITPDIIIKANDNNRIDIIGDGKNGIPTPPLIEDKELGNFKEYEQTEKYINFEKQMKETFKRINKYKDKITKISYPHDFFLLIPSSKKIGLKLLIDKKIIKNDNIILLYSFTSENNKYRYCIEKEYGKFKDSKIDDLISINGLYEILDDDIELMSKNKLFLGENEDKNAPIEWILFIIWQYILPEFFQNKSNDNKLKFLKNEKIIIKTSTKEISDYIKKIYKMPIYNGNSSQINFKTIKNAMKILKTFTEVEVIERNNLNEEYIIEWKKANNNLLKNLIKKIHDEEFIEKAKNEAKIIKLPEKQNDLSLYN